MSKRLEISSARTYKIKTLGLKGPLIRRSDTEAPAEVTKRMCPGSQAQPLHLELGTARLRISPGRGTSRAANIWSQEDFLKIYPHHQTLTWLGLMYPPSASKVQRRELKAVIRAAKATESMHEPWRMTPGMHFCSILELKHQAKRAPVHPLWQGAAHIRRRDRR